MEKRERVKTTKINKKINKNVNKWLEDIMRVEHLNQKQLAKKLKMNEAQVSRKLRYDRNYTIDDLIRISNVLSSCMTIDKLIGRRYNEKKRKWEIK